MEKKELYQFPSIEEINSLLDCAAVRGIGKGPVCLILTRMTTPTNSDVISVWQNSRQLRLTGDKKQSAEFLILQIVFLCCQSE